MAHGLPDWGLVGPRTTTYGLDDMGELAVRLGSPVVWDRRGDVIFYDNYENGLGRVQITEVGLSAAHNITCYNVWHGDYALELIVGDDDPVSYTLLSYELPRPNPSGLGFEVWFSMADHIEIFQMSFRWMEAPFYYVAGIRYDHPNQLVQYLNQANVWTTILTGFVLRECNKPVHNMKLVSNVSARQYNRLIIDNVTYDMTGLQDGRFAYAGQGYLDLHIYITSESGFHPTITLDNIIFTENEPS